MAAETRERTRALVVVPTYNERGSIKEVAERLFTATGDPVDLLVVDDASPDGTADVVRDLAADRRGIHLIERPAKLGLGSAYVAGFRWALERDYTAVVEMDGDLSHDPAAVPELLAALDRSDVVVGSRYVQGGSISNWGFLRALLSRGGNLYARAWLRLGVRDLTSGFRAYRVEALEALPLEEIRSDGYVFQIDMTRRLHHAGAAIAEVPITFVERRSGESKISRRIVWEAIFRVTRWGIADLLPPLRRKRAIPSRPETPRPRRRDR